MAELFDAENVSAPQSAQVASTVAEQGEASEVPGAQTVQALHEVAAAADHDPAGQFRHTLSVVAEHAETWNWPATHETVLQVAHGS